MWKFADYLSQKNRDAVEHLKIIKHIIESGDFEVVDKTKERDDPYLFVFNPYKNLSFEGIRLYPMGDKIAFRIQKMENTEPYGRAYSLDIEELFEDLLSHNKKDEKIAHIISDTVNNEIKEFFKQSEKAEKDQIMSLNDPLDRVLVRSGGTDYSSGVSNGSQRTGNGVY